MNEVKLNMKVISHRKKGMEMKGASGRQKRKKRRVEESEKWTAGRCEKGETERTNGEMER